MHRLSQRRQQGFTIIEVLIVLAIAGLILLIVFLAVPALQRNQRNTTRKSDVARVGGAVSEFVANSNGKIPVSTDNGAIASAAGRLGQYDFVTTLGDLTISNQTTATAALNDTRKMRVVTNAQCGAGGATALGSSSRQTVIQYTVENAGTPAPGGTPVCTEI